MCHRRHGQKNKIEFNRKQLQVAKIEATLAGHLRPGEITHELCELAEEHVKSVAKAQRERVTTYNRKSAFAQKGDMNVSGKAVACAGRGSDALCRGLLHAESIIDADVIFQKDPADVPTELWPALQVRRGSRLRAWPPEALVVQPWGSDALSRLSAAST